MKFLKNERLKSYENAKIYWICKETFEDKYAKHKNIVNLETIIILQVNIEVLHIASVIKFGIPKQIPSLWQLIYDYHFISQKLAQEFEGQFTCLGENTEIYINLTVPKEKEVKRNDKKGNHTNILQITIYW